MKHLLRTDPASCSAVEILNLYSIRVIERCTLVRIGFDFSFLHNIYSLGDLSVKQTTKQLCTLCIYGYLLLSLMNFWTRMWNRNSKLIISSYHLTSHRICWYYTSFVIVWMKNFTFKCAKPFDDTLMIAKKEVIE